MIEEERIFVVGDIHGCLGMLKRLIAKIGWRPDRDRLIFLGDYIDRGENSRGVIDYILEISNSSGRVECLMGNHEAVFLDFLSGRQHQNFFVNGGASTLNSYRFGSIPHADPMIPHDHVSFLNSLQLWIELKDYYVVHAGLRPGLAIQEQAAEDLVWIREPFIHSDHDFGKKVIFGHTPFSRPLIMKNKIGLDTGAVFGNMLTCLELPSLVFHAVEA